MRPIGVVRSPFRTHLEAPRQPRVAPIGEGVIELRRGLQNLLHDLKGFSHIWVLFWCNFSRGWNAQVVPPRDSKKRGVLATRSPHRPNPIGLSAVELLEVRGTRLRVRGLDMLDGTPVLDLKPYVRYADAIPDATDGWLAELPAESRPDHRDWRSIARVALLASAIGLSGCDSEAPSGAPESVGATEPDPSGSSVLDAPLLPPSKGDGAAALPWFQQAIAARGAWRSRDAFRAFERALEIDPAHPGALIEFGFLLLEPGGEQNYGRALLQFRRALLVEPDQLHAIVGEGVARAALNDAGRAEPLLRRAIAELPEAAVGRRAWSALALADLAVIAGRNDEALALYAQAADPKVAVLQRCGALVHSADLLLQLDRPMEAEPRLRQALAIDPENVRAHHFLAQLLARRDSSERPDATARAEAQKEARIHELLRQLRDHLSAQYVQDRERRTTLWRELSTVWPEHRRLPYSLARDQLDCGDWNGAKSTTTELLARDGATAEASWLAARAEAGCGDIAAAKRHADAMSRADPNVPTAVLRTVLEEWRRGNPDTVDAATFDRTVREWLLGR
ncbi:MAG: tRNA (N6-threonylcarbamoyladenosine(37)-N6)-methyltransferase TrmO [Planctomycetes bacterium]|nr:tRNA (N6-threonylcarbamoyladenosine(37)-N6)-methyltransferase TrmO [Planctomycetota bacterium]